MADFTLLNSMSATGTWLAIQGGRYAWRVYGTWNGATAQLQISPDGGATAINIDGVAVSADGGWNGIPLGSEFVRVLVTGGGGGTSLSSRLLQVA